MNQDDEVLRDQIETTTETTTITDKSLNNLDIKLCEIPLKSFSGNSPIYKEFIISNPFPSSQQQQQQQIPHKESYSSGGYTYLYNNNRYILWRISNSFLELSEYQLTSTLSDNSIKINFEDTTIKSSEIGFHETSKYLVITLITSNKILYRFLFPHPNNSDSNQIQKVGSKRKNDSESMKSVFSQLNISDLDNSWSRLKYVVPESFNITCIRFIGGIYCSLGSVESGSYWIELSDFKKNGDLQCRSRSEFIKGSFFSSLFFKPKQEYVQDMQIVENSHLGLNNYLVFILTQDYHIKIWSSQDKILYHDFELDLESWNQLSITRDVRVESLQLKVQPIKGTTKYLVIIYIQLEQESIFTTYRIDAQLPNIEKDLEKYSFTKSKGLIDFKIYENHLLTLWDNLYDDENDNKVEDRPIGNQLSFKYMNLGFDETDNFEVNQFFEGFMSQPLIRGIQIPSGSQAEEIPHLFMERIFKRNQFTAASIIESLESYKSSFNYDNEMNLEDQAYQTIQDKIQSLAHANPSTPEIDIISNEWSQFYGYCVDNQVQELKGSGIFIQEPNKMIFLIKRNQCSLMKPTPLDMLYQVDEFHSKSDLTKSVTSPDIQKLLDCVNLIGKQFNHNDFSPLEYALSISKIKTAIQKQTEMILNNPEFIGEFLLTFGEINQPLNIISNILERLDLEFLINSDNNNNNSGCEIRTPIQKQPSPQNQSDFWIGESFNDILSSSFESTIRAKIQNLSAISVILQICSNENLSVSLKNIKTDESFIMIYTQSLGLLSHYFLLNWATFQIYSKVTTEANISLDEMNLGSQSQSSQLQETVIHHLIKVHGHQFSSECKSSDIYENINRNLSKLLLVLSPEKNLFGIGSFLAEQSQFTQLSYFLDMIISNEMINVADLSKYYYLRGICQVHQGEYQDGYKSMLKGIQGLNDMDMIRICLLSSEEFVEKIFMENAFNENYNSDLIIFNYIMKSIKLFELKKQSEFIIQLSLYAIDFIQVKQSEQVFDEEFLQIKLEQLSHLLFKFSVDIGRYEIAFLAANTNPTANGVDEYLKKLVIILSQSSRIDELYSLPFKPYFVEKQLISLSKSQDIYIKPDYYMILYGYYIQRCNYQGAASTLYEKASRILRESHSYIKSSIDNDQIIRNRLELLSLTISSMKFLEESNRYISAMDLSVQHISPSSSSSSSSQHSNKRKLNNGFEEMSIQEPTSPQPLKRNIKIVWLRDIEREYIYLLSFKYLYQVDPSISVNLTPLQMIDALIDHGMFDRAITFSIHFDLDLGKIFESFTSKSIQLQQQQQQDSIIFGANDVGFEYSDYQHLNDISQISWEVLKNYLERYDQPEFDLDCISTSELCQEIKENRISNHYKIVGVVCKDSFKDFQSGCQFTIMDEKSFTLSISYHKKQPIFFKEGEKLVVEGSFDQSSNQFIAKKVLCKKGQTRYHELVADRILSTPSTVSGINSIPLPNWLVQWFLNGRSDTLFKLYFKHSRIMEAFDVLDSIFKSAIEFSENKQQYEIEKDRLPFIIPYNIIEQFLVEIRQLESKTGQSEELKSKIKKSNSHIKSQIEKYLKIAITKQ